MKWSISYCWDWGWQMGSASKIIWSAAVAVTQAPIISVPAPMALPYLGASSLLTLRRLYQWTVDALPRRKWRFLVFGRKSFLDHLETAMDAYRSGD